MLQATLGAPPPADMAADLEAAGQVVREVEASLREGLRT